MDTQFRHNNYPKIVFSWEIACNIVTLFVITWTCRHANTTTETLSELTWITFKCTWLFNVAVATTRNHVIQDSFSEAWDSPIFYTITYIFHIIIDMNDWRFGGIHTLPYYHLYLPYQPLASTVVLNHMHPNELQTWHRVYLHLSQRQQYK